MKFKGFQIAKYSTKKGIGYTLYALGADGQIYKGAFNGSKHVGWIPLETQILPKDWEVTVWEGRMRRREEPLPTDESTSPMEPLLK